MDPLQIAGSALTAERLRMDAISSNIANINTTRDHLGRLNPYKRKLVVFKTILDEAQNQKAGVTVDKIINDNAPMRYVFDPSHPDSNAEGYVVYPNVSIEREMVDMAAAKAAYEANITAIRTYKSMFGAALDI